MFHHQDLSLLSLYEGKTFFFLHFFVEILREILQEYFEILNDKSKGMYNGAKLGVAAVARAPPFFLPSPEILYINMLHFFCLPQTYLVHAPPVLSPDWRQ